MRPVAIVASATAVALLSLACATACAHAGGTLRIAVTAADVPTTTGMPNNGYEGIRFLGFPVFEGLILFDLTRSDVPATVRPGLAERWGQDKADPTAESVSVIPFALIQLAPGDAASLLIPPGAP